MRYFPTVIFWVLLCMQSAVSAGPMGAKIEVLTKVYSVAVDGSVQLLRPSPSFALDPSTLKNFSARILLPTPSATGSSAEVPKQRVAGDVLRYEITVSNETDFLVPALALDIREQLAPGVALLAYSQEQKNRWHIELVDNSRSLVSGSSQSNRNSSAPMKIRSSGQRLRLQNLEPLGAGGQLVFAYDVTVLESHGRELQTP